MRAHFLLPLLFFFYIVHVKLNACNCNSSNTTDSAALLSFKAQILEDPYQSLDSWNQKTLGFCQWQGVTCTIREGQPRVTAITLDSFSLAGPISPSLANLTFLQNLQLPGNRLFGLIPHQLSSLPFLQHLNLSNNYLEGEIPPLFGNLSCLSTLVLSSNNLSGHLPLSLSNISSLTFLDLHHNKLSGVLPNSIGYTLPLLQQLTLSDNDFSGTIPTSIGALQNLRGLVLQHNKLISGDWAFLAALTNCSNLRWLLLSDNKLSGSIPNNIGNLSTQIESIELDRNQISGHIPLQIINLDSLLRLVLGDNRLTTTIPAVIWELPRLQVLSLANSRIPGSIPASLGNNGSYLRVVVLPGNSLTGRIPPSIGNITSLTWLILNDNHLIGRIPASLANLRTLTSLHLLFNLLTGPLPPPIWNISSLQYLLVELDKGIIGALPSDVGRTLPRLQYLYISGELHGTIPSSLSNATELEYIELCNGSLKGTIPRSLGTLKHLKTLLLSNNQLEASGPDGWGFLEALSNCTNLKKLSLSHNKLSGMLPSTIGNLSAGLYQLLIRSNFIEGQIPADISKLINITMLDLGRNFLSGKILSSIGKLSRLQVLYLDQNKLSGEIPSTIGNLTLLNRLYLDVNYLNGNIPISLTNCPLELLYLDHNNLTGQIPKEIFSITSLAIYLGLSANSFTGLLPKEVGALKNLRFLSVSDNKMIGTIPIELGECEILEVLHMTNNNFNGSIPLSLQNLKGLKELDLSRNNLSGTIPRFFVNLPALKNLNLSFNNLEGEVPTDGIFRDSEAISVIGNIHLCSSHPSFDLQPCTSPASRKRSSLIVILPVINIVLALLIIMFVAFFYWRWRKSRDSESLTESHEDQHQQISYCPRDYIETSYEVLHNATDGFSSTNLIGVGSFGTVYKGVMDCDGIKTVAIKVLNLDERGASKSFLTECATLRNIRHRNLIKVLTCCSSCDPLGNEFRALVFDYMPNGSLDMWLYPRANAPVNRKRLNLIQRLKVASDVASALNYLHHSAPTTIIHCDLKPGNVLLDDFMNAHLGDFGLARLIVETTNESHQHPTSTTTFKGSIGYVAPEYGLAHKASKQGDVYSYGILLLEMFTGRSPTSDIFTEGINLSRYVEIAYPEQVLDVTDPVLLLECEDAELNREDVIYNEEEEGTKESQDRDTAKGLRDCLASLFKVGIACTKESPSERMQMGEVTKELMAVLLNILHPQL